MNDEALKSALARRRQWQQLSEFRGAPAEFWALLTKTVGQCLGGELVVLYVLSVAPEGGEIWQPMGYWPPVAAEKLPGLVESVSVDTLRAARSLGLAFGTATQGTWRVGLASLSTDAGRRELMLAVHLQPGRAGTLAEDEGRQWLATFQSAPWLYEASRNQRATERDAVRLAQAIELLGRVLESENIDQASLAVANELAERFGCETVSLSWRGDAGLRLRAISHAEKLDRRSELSTLLEECAQEALAQACEVNWPAGGKVVTRAHQQYAELQAPGHLLTLPMMRAQDRLGALTLERQRMGFSAAEQWALRMICDLLLPPLAALESRSRPLYRRLGDDIWRSVPPRFKPASAEGRQFARGLVIATLVALWLPLPYSVDSGAVVKTEVMAFVGAPFDGYLESSNSSLGASVKAGDVLFTMATRELTLDRASILADLAQYQRDAEKRRAANQLPEMQIAEAQVNQAAARLQQVDYRLANAQARSPIDGVVVEGEPGKNLGGAVRRGDVMVKVAALNGLYIEAAVRERDLSRVAVDQSARLTLLANTAATYETRVARIVPSATVKDGENTFPARLELTDPAADWWRPGMSGVARIDVGFRPLIWIASHRLLDYLRLVLWV